MGCLYEVIIPSLIKTLDVGVWVLGESCRQGLEFIIRAFLAHDDWLEMASDSVGYVRVHGVISLQDKVGVGREFFPHLIVMGKVFLIFLI